MKNQHRYLVSAGTQKKCIWAFNTLSLIVPIMGKIVGQAKF